VNNEEGRTNYRRLRNDLKRATEKVKNEYLERICNEIIYRVIKKSLCT
jgi:hypothetical protein